MLRAIGRGRTNPNSKANASRVRAYTATNNGRRATLAMPPIGTTGPAKPFCRKPLDAEWRSLVEALLALEHSQYFDAILEGTTPTGEHKVVPVHSVFSDSYFFTCCHRSPF